MGALTDAAKKASAKTDRSLERVNAKILEYAESVKAGTKTVLRKKAGEIVRDAMRKHPVDTGQSRAGWSVGLEALGHKLEMPSISPTTKKPILPTDVAKGRAQGGFDELKAKTKYAISVSNGVRHAVYLEAGYSKQAPRGFVRRALLIRRSKIREELRSVRVKGVQ